MIASFIHKPKVYLIGAGPGDPDLITWKGRQILERADSILYDHLANDALLALAPAHAERLYVGKKKSSHAFDQEEISALLVERGRRGLTVVRLKGGDPFIFGRGGEEVEALAAAGVAFEVVPGITTPLGIAAYTGVPLTHREHTSVVTFVTGHNVEQIDWSRIGSADTLVIFMGLTSIVEITRRIAAGGRAPETPAMAVRWATRADQQIVMGTLSTIAELVERHHLQPPATIVIGDVVSLRDKLDWFGKLPLSGQRVVVTRPRLQAAEFTSGLRALGADVIEFPTIEIAPPADPAPLNVAIGQLHAYDWLIFTSVNGVAHFLEALDRSSVDLRALRARIAAIGPATREAVERLHLKVDLMPVEYVAESLVEAFAGESLSGKRILLPRAAVARDLVPEELTRRGALVDVVEAYRTVVPQPAPGLIESTFVKRKPHWITFTSSSTVTNFLALVGAEALQGVKVASIGPITSDSCRQHGIAVDLEPATHTIGGLLNCLENFKS